MALTDKLTAIADAIRAKTGKTGGMTLDQMVAEIAGIETGGVSGEEIFFPGVIGVSAYASETCNLEQLSNYQTPYTRNMVFNKTSWQIASGANMYRDADEMVSFRSNVLVGGDNMFRDCNKLETFICEATGAINNSGWCLNYCTALKNAQFGGIGKPITQFSNVDYFRNCTQSDLVITVYVDANTLAEAAAICPAIPGFAVNATVVYRNSTTGEVIAE